MLIGGCVGGGEGAEQETHLGLMAFKIRPKGTVARETGGDGLEL